MKILSELLLKNRVKLITSVYKNYLDNNEKVLDIGCGDGIVTDELTKQLSVNITGCDIEKYLIRNIPYIHMLQENVLPFKDSQFSTVMFNDVLHHTSFNIQISLLKEAIRVAKKQVLIFELEPSLINSLFDVVLNQIYHSKMKIPLTMRKKLDWLKLFNKLPCSIEIINLPSKHISPFSRIAFCITLLP